MQNIRYPKKCRTNCVVFYFSLQSATIENLESQFVKLTNVDEPVIVGVVHRPPSGDINLWTHSRGYLWLSGENGDILHRIANLTEPKFVHMCAVTAANPAKL